MLLEAISTIMSTIAFSLFVFGIPLLVLRGWRARKPIEGSLAVTSFLWLVFMSVSLAFCMVHFEARYALPVLPAELLGIVYMLQRLRAGLHRWTSGKQFTVLSERDAEASARQPELSVTRRRSGCGRSPDDLLRPDPA
jgi:hypothetical protein